MRFTPTARLADHLLPGGVEHFVRSRRANGISWRRIALDMRDATNATLDVTHEAVRGWFRDENGKAA